MYASEQQHHMHHGSMKAPLSEAGNDAFGTIQEVIKKLNADPNTQWKDVNIEALRGHLVDMHNMTINVDVLSQVPIKDGLKATIEPTTKRANEALQRVFSAHPKMLTMETGWTMQVTKEYENYTLTITTTKKEEIDKIRALGYIGIMAWGDHHQPHHWMMATGKNPH